MRYIDPALAPAQEATPKIISAPDAQASNWADRKLTSTQRADLAFRYQDWLLTKNIPSGGFRILYVISQCFNEENPFHCYPSLEYLAARSGRTKPTVWEMLPKLEKIGVIDIEWGSRGSGHPNTYRLPAAFLEFYFGPEKGRRKQPKKVRAALLSKPRPAGVSNEQKSSVEPSEKLGLPIEKVRPALLNHLVATYNNQERASGPRSSGVEIQSPPNSAVTAADDESQSPALEVDIPKQEREGTKALRLCSAGVEETDQAETLPLNALHCPIWLPVANGAALDLVGHAARRPEQTRPDQRGNEMARIARTREQLFTNLKNIYPVVGLDDETNFAAFELCLDHGVDRDELFADALDQRDYAKDGRDVVPLVEFLLSRCWTERIAA